MHQFNRVGVVGRLEGNAQSIDTLKHLIDYLESKAIEIVLEAHVSYVLPGHGLEVYCHEDLGNQCDLAIVVGGDGSMLTAARALAKHHVPVVGINRGGLGFLTDIAPDEQQMRFDAADSPDKVSLQSLLWCVEAHLLFSRRAAV